MADDIQITGSSQSGSFQTGSNPPGASNSGTPNPGQLNTEGSPVIDLRQLDKDSSVAGSSASSSRNNGGANLGGSSVNPIPAGNKNSAGSSAINLEEAALMEAQTVLGPPEKYAIPSLVKEKFPDIIELIKETESMNDEERDYWFQILPIMTEQQIEKFRMILLNEKKQLEQLDKQYEEELTKLNEKHMLEWKEFETREKRKALIQAEKSSQADEEAAEQALLQRLSQL